MARVQPGSPLYGLSGKFGKFYLRQQNGETIMAACPGPRKKTTALQEVGNDKFRAASEYAKRQTSKDQIKQLYSTGITKKKHSAYLVAVADFLKPPVINSVNVSLYNGKAADQISVDASDDFMVVTVEVELRNASGTSIEQGKACQSLKDGLWKYTVQRSHKIHKGIKAIVKAFDFAQNMTMTEIALVNR